MKINVTYHKNDVQSAIWDITHKFTYKEDESVAEIVTVKGLKPATRSFTKNWEDVMNCKKQTGLTESEYQAKHHHAWSA